MTHNENSKEEAVLKQVNNWDRYAKWSPIIFLFVTVTLWSLGLLSITSGFYIVIIIFAIIAVIWWLWTIYTIRYLVRIILRTNVRLKWVSREFQSIREELRKHSVDNEP